MKTLILTLILFSASLLASDQLLGVHTKAPGQCIKVIAKVIKDQHVEKIANSIQEQSIKETVSQRIIYNKRPLIR